MPWKLFARGARKKKRARKDHMFKVTGPVLSSRELKATKFEAAKAAKFPSRETKGQWSKNQWAKLRKAWDLFTGPVHDPEHFIFCVEYSDGVYSAIEYDRGTITVDLLDTEELEEYAELLPATKPVAQLKAEPRQPPNALCRCGSLRKAKRCCG